MCDHCCFQKRGIYFLNFCLSFLGVKYSLITITNNTYTKLCDLSDFQKVAALIHEFLLKLSDDYECAELRDTLNLALLHMQRYYRKLRKRMQSQESAPQEATMLGRSLRGMSPMTPFRVSCYYAT